MNPRPSTVGDHEFVIAVAETLRRFRESAGAIAGAARAEGVSVEAWEAGILASVVADWMARLPKPDSTGKQFGFDAEAVRAAVAMRACLPVVIPVRVPPALAIRLVELAGATGVTVEQAALALLSSGADSAMAASQATNQPPPRPWQGGCRVS
jgi:hypothetical protein